MTYEIICILIGCLVITCPPVPELTHAEVNTTSALYGTNVRLTCHPGYVFLDNNTDVTITCQESGNWSYIPDDCIGAVINIYFINACLCLTKVTIH